MGAYDDIKDDHNLLERNSIASREALFFFGADEL